MKPCRKCGASDRNKRGNCRACQAKGCAKWRAENPEKAKAGQAKWYAANSEKRKASVTKWRAENPEKMKAAVAKWRAANPEKKKAAEARWVKDNPKLRRIGNHNRLARKQANGGKLSKGLADILYARQKGKCSCCKEPLGDKYHLDHIVPIKLGGANEDWNIQLLRAKCNVRKGAKHPVDYMREKGFLL